MHEDFCTYEQSVKLNKLGFNWKCYKKYGIKPMTIGKISLKKNIKWTDYPEGYLYDKDRPKYRKEYFVNAPTLYQAQKWLREVKNIEIFVTKTPMNPDAYNILIIGNGITADDIGCDTYEEALSYGIDEVLAISAF